MPMLPAYDGITLALGGNTVRLRPSLRAASRLTRSPDDMRIPVLNFHLGTIREIITMAATDEREATAFLAKIDATPLQIVADSIIAPLFVFLASFAPAEDRPGTADNAPSGNAPSGSPMAWRDVVKMLHRRATGWLHWTPETAWNATPSEINDALAGWLEYMEVTTPKGKNETVSDSKPLDVYTPEQLQQIEEQGFDPAFDRAGLRALKRKIASGR